MDVSQDAASMEVEANGRKSALRNGPYTAPPSKVARTLDSELEIAADAVPETQGGSGTGVGGSGAEGSGGKKFFPPVPPFQGAGVDAGDAGAGGVGVGGSQQSGTTDASMTMLLAEMKAMNTNLNTKFASLDKKLSDQSQEFKVELGKLRADTVAKETFSVLEVRLKNLESGGVPNSQITWFQDQLHRLDPANKSMCFSGFKSDDANSRIQYIEALLRHLAGPQNS